MPKFIEDQERLDYKERFKQFSAVVNPKPSTEELEKRLKEYMDSRITEGVCLDESE